MDSAPFQGVTETVVLETPVLIGYARISKADGSQSLDLQRDALREAGVHGRCDLRGPGVRTA